MTFLRPLSLLLVVPALAIAGCGDKTVKADEVEKELTAEQKKKAPGLAVTNAKCPDDVKAEKGETFKCTVEVEGVEAPYTVSITSVEDDEAKFNLRNSQPILDLRKAESALAQQTGAEADCGREKVVVTKIKGRFECTLSKGSNSQKVTLEVTNLQGTVRVVGSS